MNTTQPPENPEPGPLLGLGSSAELGPLLENALRRAYYYTDTGAWRGPMTEESDRWRAVAKVAAEMLAAERDRTLRATVAMRIAAECIAAAYKDDWPAFDRLSDDFDDAVAAVSEGPNVEVSR
jgi:hypothetical protein